jgi:purine-binding chemotaxis protein CheW
MVVDFYAVLEVAHGVDQETIEAAYRRLALLYHPDLNRSPEATRRMQEVNVAYMTLHNPTKRAVYDRDHGIPAASSFSRRNTAPAAREAYRPNVTYNSPQPPPHPVSDSGPGTETQLLTFYIEQSAYALNILDVESVNMMQPILQHLRAPVFIEGLVAYRSQRVPVIDLRRHLGFPNRPTTRDTRILVVKFNGISTGLIVDSTGAPLRVDNTQIEAPHTISSEQQLHFVKGIVHSGFQVVVILDLPALLTKEEYQALRNFVS